MGANTTLPAARSTSATPRPPAMKTQHEAVLQASGKIEAEARIDVNDVARGVAYMASLPLDANVQFMTVMATKMPYIGRG